MASGRGAMHEYLIKAMRHEQRKIFDHLLALVPRSVRASTRRLTFEGAACAGLLAWVKTLYNLGFAADLFLVDIQALWFTVARRSAREHGTLVFDYLAEQWPWLEEFRYDRRTCAFAHLSDLSIVCKNGNVPMAKRLLGLGANQVLEAHDFLPLFEAVKAEDYEMAKLLLSSGIELDLNRHHKTAQDLLLKACERSSIDIVELLIRCGAKVITRRQVMTLATSAYLDSAIGGGHLPMIQYWLARGHEVRTDALHSFFIGATSSQKAWVSAADAVRLLIDSGASATIRRIGNLTPLAFFVSRLHFVLDSQVETDTGCDVALDIAKLLVSHGTDCKGIFGTRHARRNIGSSSQWLRQFLLDQPDIARIQLRTWFKCLDDAAYTSDEVWFSTLLEHMPQHKTWTSCQQPIERVISKVCRSWENIGRGSRCRVLRKILGPNAETSECMVGLCGSTYADVEALRLLLAANKDCTSAMPDDYSTPLHAACNLGHASLVSVLLETGADVAAKDRWGATPMDKALSKSGNADYPFSGVFGLLLMHGSPLGSRRITDAEIDARPGFRQVLDKYVSRAELVKWLTM